LKKGLVNTSNFGKQSDTKIYIDESKLVGEAQIHWYSIYRHFGHTLVVEKMRIYYELLALLGSLLISISAQSVTQMGFLDDTSDYRKYFTFYAGVTAIAMFLTAVVISTIIVGAVTKAGEAQFVKMLESKIMMIFNIPPLFIFSAIIFCLMGLGAQFKVDVVLYSAYGCCVVVLVGSFIVIFVFFRRKITTIKEKPVKASGSLSMGNFQTQKAIEV